VGSPELRTLSALPAAAYEEAVSPELCLVDPELAARLRAAPAALAPVGPPVFPIVRLPAGPGTLAEPVEPRSARRTRIGLLAAAAAAVVAIAVGAGTAALSGTGSGARPSARANEPPPVRIAWHGTPDVAWYRVRVSQAGRVVLTTYVSKPRYTLPAQLRRTPGEYIWEAAAVRDLLRPPQVVATGRLAVGDPAT
jgi:hypothetical protein